MTRPEIERLTVIETKFETVIEPMALKVDQIYDNFKETSRKANSSHEFINSLKADGCPKAHIVKRQSDGNGGYLERRTKKPWRQQFKETSLIKKLAFVIAAIPFLGAYWQWIFTKAHEVLNWIEALPK